MTFNFEPTWEEIKGCPLCSWRDSVVFDRRTEHGIKFVNNLCKQCGLVYQNPRMDEASLAEYYNSIYINQHQGAQGVSEKEIEIQKRRAQYVISLLRQQDAEISYHLDIGSSTGILMAALEQSFGTKPIGIEPAETYRRYALQKDLEVYATLDQVPVAYKQRFDLITMLHVVEHLRDPLEFLIHVRERSLAKDGLLAVEVPNLFFHPTFELPHLTHYHAETLQALLEKSGYIIQRVVKHGSPRSRHFPLNLLVFAHPASDKINTLSTWPSHRMIRGKRLWGRIQFLLVANMLKLLRLGRPTRLEVLDRTK